MTPERAKLREACALLAEPSRAGRLRYEAAEKCAVAALPGLLDALDTAEAEIERLKAGGCARGDQRTTQHCAEAAALAAENTRLRFKILAYTHEETFRPLDTTEPSDPKQENPPQ